MVNLNLKNFNKKDLKSAPMECALYLVECLDDETKAKLKEDWAEVGKEKNVPLWKWILEHIEVSYTYERKNV